MSDVHVMLDPDGRPFRLWHYPDAAGCIAKPAQSINSGTTELGRTAPSSGSG